MIINSTNQTKIIPNDRPVQGGDLELLRLRFGCSVKHMISVLGISSRNKWQELTDQKRALPLQDAALALVARRYDQHPNEFPLEHGINIGDVMALLAEHNITSISASRFAVLIGRSKTVGPKYVTGTQPDPSAHIAIGILYDLIKDGKLNEWLEIVNIESVARKLKKDISIPDDYNDIQSWLSMDSWGGRTRAVKPLKTYKGTNRRSETQSIKIAPEEDRRQHL